MQFAYDHWHYGMAQHRHLVYRMKSFLINTQPLTHYKKVPKFFERILCIRNAIPIAISWNKSLPHSNVAIVSNDRFHQLNDHHRRHNAEPISSAMSNEMQWLSWGIFVQKIYNFGPSELLMSGFRVVLNLMSDVLAENFSVCQSLNHTKWLIKHFFSADQHHIRDVVACWSLII